MTIGERLQKARLAKGLTQAQLARAIGVSMSSIAMVETGLRGQPRKLRAMAALLGVSADWLETGEGDPYEVAVERSTAWPLERLKESTWRSLTERQKALLEDVMMTKLRELQAEAQDDELPTGPRRKPTATGT